MSNAKSTAASSSLGIGTILFLIFLVLKLAKIGTVATWSWWWVTCPLWIGIIIPVTFLIIFSIGVVIVVIGKKIINK